MYSTEEQKRYLQTLTAAYSKRTNASQQRREATWPALADARSSQGFFAQMPPAAKQIWLATKQLRHPIVADRAAGARVWDIDGHEYVDYCLGFGVFLFGHKPVFVDDALRRQLDRGMPIGYQSDRANEVANAVASMTNAERVAFCNTGAEAVMGAVRLARAATKREKIAVFSGSYHGSYTAVLPATNMHHGLSSNQKGDTLVLEYGASRSLELIAENAGELACVIVEPVQARSLHLQPVAFLRELRSLTRDKDIALVFDDILVGFRIHQGGTQAFFDIRADMATFGKVIGGGLPIGVITGGARYLNAIDGGRWSAFDETGPAADKVWFAGTFTKNPLTMAAAHAVTHRLREAGNGLQEGLNEKTAKLAERVNAWLTEHSMPVRIEHFGSMFRIAAAPPLWIVMAHLRMRGIYAFDGMNFFLSTEHGERELTQFEDALKESLTDMRAGGMIQ